MTHFIDETGDIPKQMPKEARELASFMALVVDETTKIQPTTSTSIGLSCFKKKCSGIICSEFNISNTIAIHWKCSNCDHEGIISEWQGTK